MKPKAIYLALCFLGTLLPYWKFLPWLLEHGLNPALFLRELLVNRISILRVGCDRLGACASSLHTSGELAVGSVKRWLPVVAVLVVGISLGLPLFLSMRELKLGTT